MKHLKKFNEALKEPIDVESDIIEFKEKLGKAYYNFFLKMYVYSPEEEYTKAMNSIEHLIISNPTMTDDWDVWEVYGTDDYGRNSGTIGKSCLLECLLQYLSRLSKQTCLVVSLLLLCFLFQ